MDGGGGGWKNFFLVEEGVFQHDKRIVNICGIGFGFLNLEYSLMSYIIVIVGQTIPAICFLLTNTGPNLFLFPQTLGDVTRSFSFKM